MPDLETIKQKQLESLQALLAEIIPDNRFYADRLRAAGITPKSTIEDLMHLPFTTKDELVQDQKDHPPYGSNLSYPIDQYNRFCKTSGTGGDPIIWLDTEDGWSWMLDNWIQIYKHSGVTADDIVYFAFSYGPFLGFWTAHEAAVKMGCLCIPGGGLSSLARVHEIIEQQATLLCCTPTYALRLAEVAREQEIDLATASVKTIIVAGEPGGSIGNINDAISKAWNGARVCDHHGMTEVGPVSFEDPDHKSVLCILEDRYLAEVVHLENGEAVAPGETGELILTTLGRACSPLLRYKTGDLVKPLPREDGKFLGLDGGIIGRIDDMIIVRGVNLYPSAVDAVVRAFSEITEYEVNIDESPTLTQISLRIEGADSTTAQKLEEELTTVFSLRIPVTTVGKGTLPQQEFKAKRWKQNSNG